MNNYEILKYKNHLKRTMMRMKTILPIDYARVFQFETLKKRLKRFQKKS